jgi:HlyD family secretion protein
VLMRPVTEVEKILAEHAKGGKTAGKADTKERRPAASGAEAAEKAAAAPSAAKGPATAAAKGASSGQDMREVVFKVVDGKAVLVPVKTGISDDTSVVVLEGVAEGDTVVTGPYRAAKKLKDGDAVKEASTKGKGKDEEGSGVEVSVN